MNKTILTLTLLLTFVSCGKNNKSGEPAAVNPLVPGLPVPQPYLVNEEGIRRDFYNRAQLLLKQYDQEIGRLFGLRTSGLIRNRLKFESIEVSERLLLDERNQYVRSNQRDYVVILYVGQEEPHLSWRSRRGQSLEYDRLVMHELLLLGNIADQNFFYTNQILRRR